MKLKLDFSNNLAAQDMINIIMKKRIYLIKKQSSMQLIMICMVEL